MKKLKLLFITGSRGEWGYIRPILRLCNKRKDVNFSLCVTNMHLLPDFGLSIKEIERDGFHVDYKIYMSLDGYNHYTMVKSLGVFLSSLADVVASTKPDWIILAGDRGEQLMGAIVGAFCYIPVAHIQAGELSGNIDGMTRHAIGKYAHLHFASNEDAAERLIKLGEEPFRIHIVGAPQLDELVQGLYTKRDNLFNKYSLNLQNYLLVMLHPVTEEYHKASEQVEILMRALSKFDMPKIVILPNNDAGSLMIREGIENNRKGDFYVFSNLSREDYLGFLKYCSAIVGNSSSGILEAPTFKIPAVNIGRRQHKRLRGNNVIDVDFEEEAIISAIKKAISKEFREMLKNNCTNPYGDGKSSERILNILINIPINDTLLIKNLTY
ncbi:UDP-N-acetylglucosamine 2-epimerase [Thermodesulfovibrio yellowstonii]|uniref:UDP-N-acetylglucosamine 2-epimerase n=1 Tax=Thermodesulfovibrio yellowstonii (strain ATCC 51303 / DSM 11347 / YP87) TaxID=289376 RepID=B5YJB0_THEYD|nr:UDP-N-acetylglucosamine 2-epimerase [Thermodesulfovibrio yellowstonii]ACI21188.1 UDP-N-acetylglucosamine 2-epimerase [Thermodesulfovibrio yellowstonii DSM 11347]